MQTKTHLALGHYLLDREADAGLHRYRGLFLPGCTSRITTLSPICAD